MTFLILKFINIDVANKKLLIIKKIYIFKSLNNKKIYVQNVINKLLKYFTYYKKLSFLKKIFKKLINLQIFYSPYKKQMG